MYIYIVCIPLGHKVWWFLTWTPLQSTLTLWVHWYCVGPWVLVTRWWDLPCWHAGILYTFPVRISAVSNNMVWITKEYLYELHWVPFLAGTNMCLSLYDVYIFFIISIDTPDEALIVKHVEDSHSDFDILYLIYFYSYMSLEEDMMYIYDILLDVK